MPSISLGLAGVGSAAAFLLSQRSTAARANPKHRWVQTQRGIPDASPHVTAEKENPCDGCGGLGRCNCWTCDGRGRLNYSEEKVLPKGVFPVWCTNCRGGGLVYCDRCMGTGVKRDPVGFLI